MKNICKKILNFVFVKKRKQKIEFTEEEILEIKTESVVARYLIQGEMKNPDITFEKKQELIEKDLLWKNIQKKI